MSADCSRCAALQAELDRAHAVLAQCLAQTRIARINQDVALEALEGYLEPDPDRLLCAS